MQNLHKYLLVEKIEEKGKGVFTTKPIKKHTLVVVGKPIGVSKVRTDMSFQVAWDKHVLLDDPAERLNHSCNPNLGIRPNEFGGYNFIARRDIKKGEELTWCYPTSEYTSIAVKECFCKSPNCQKEIKGWESLKEKMRKTFLEEGYAAPFILEKELKKHTFPDTSEK